VRDGFIFTNKENGPQFVEITIEGIFDREGRKRLPLERVL